MLPLVIAGRNANVDKMKLEGKILAAACLLACFATKPVAGQSCPLPFEAETSQQNAVPGESSAATAANTWVFIDGSGSMAGYTRSRGPSAPYDRVYVDVMSGLPVALRAAAARSGTPPVFHRFGRRIVPLAERNLPDLAKTDFYACPGKECDNQESRIDVVLKVASTVGPNDLVVVVTDLFISDQHIVGESAAALRNSLVAILRAGRSIGILGMKSGFRGRITDLATPKAVYSDAEQVPFYILVVGSSERIERFYSVMDAEFLRHLPSGAHQYSVFTTSIVKRPIRNAELPKGALEFGEGSRPISFLPHGGGAEVPQYRMKRTATEGVGIIPRFLDVPSGIERRLKAAFKPFMLPWMGHGGAWRWKRGTCLRSGLA